MVDVLIIGAGPAGLSAAIYALRAGHTAVVLEELIYGGQVANTPDVENYPAIGHISGVDFAMNIYNQAVALGADVQFDGAAAVDLTGPVKKVTTTGGKVWEAKTVIIANGARRRKLECPGEAEFTARGVSYCATCDGAFYRGQDVAIVGGGNTALEDAMFLANNCKTVHLIHRRDTFRGNQILVDALLKKENITIHYDSVPQRITGEQTVSGITLKNVKTEEETSVPVSGVFVAVGLIPDNALFADQITLDPAGYVQAGEDCHTNLPGVFVAGDTRTKTLRQIVTAASDGAMAAVEASNYINQN